MLCICPSLSLGHSQASDGVFAWLFGQPSYSAKVFSSVSVSNMDRSVGNVLCLGPRVEIMALLPPYAEMVSILYETPLLAPVDVQVKIQPPELKAYMDKKLSSECSFGHWRWLG
jgi:hypothetical protein